MIKTVIKKQIRKTGMVRELEMDKEKLQRDVSALEVDTKKLQGQINSLWNENEKLRGQVNDLEIDKEKLQGQINALEIVNIDFKTQINDLKREKQKFLAKGSEIVGFSLKTDIRGISTDAGKPDILKYILENVKKNAKILDVGFGSGIYGKLLRTFCYQNIDGIDVYDKNIKEMGLDKIYDNIFIEDILDFNFDYYDLIIMGDVLEHIELKLAKKLLSSLIKENKCSQILVSIPYEYEQEEIYGNKHEKHLQPDVTADYMKKHYPYLKLINSAIMPHNGGIIATYIWNENLEPLKY